MNYTYLSQNIKALRECHGLTQEELAAQIDVRLRTLELFENGLAFPTYEVLEKITNALHISPNILLCGDCEKVPSVTIMQINDALCVSSSKHDDENLENLTCALVMELIRLKRPELDTSEYLHRFLNSFADMFIEQFANMSIERMGFGSYEQ